MTQGAKLHGSMWPGKLLAKSAESDAGRYWTETEGRPERIVIVLEASEANVLYLESIRNANCKSLVYNPFLELHTDLFALERL